MLVPSNMLPPVEIKEVESTKKVKIILNSNPF